MHVPCGALIAYYCQDDVLAITPDRIFYAAPGPRADQYLRQEAIPSACRTR